MSHKGSDKYKGRRNEDKKDYKDKAINATLLKKMILMNMMMKWCMLQ